MVSTREFIDDMIAFYMDGNQNAEAAVFDILNRVVDDGNLSELNYFLCIAPEEAIAAMGRLLERYKELGFYIFPPIAFGRLGEARARKLSEDRAKGFEAAYKMLAERDL